MTGEAAAIYRISEGTDGVRETMALMRKIVRQYKGDPDMKVFANNLIAHLPERSWSAEVEALYNYVRDHIRYTLDADGVEQLSTPDFLLAHGSGDCDDKSILLATLLAATGHPARFRAIGFNGGELSHVLVDTLIGENWIPLDTTENLPAGEVAFDPAAVKNTWIVKV